jgi:hypothetical protein
LKNGIVDLQKLHIFLTTILKGILITSQCDVRLALGEHIGGAILPNEGEFFTALRLRKVLNPIGHGLIGKWCRHRILT